MRTIQNEMIKQVENGPRPERSRVRREEPPPESAPPAVQRHEGLTDDDGSEEGRDEEGASQEGRPRRRPEEGAGQEGRAKKSTAKRTAASGRPAEDRLPAGLQPRPPRWLYAAASTWSWSGEDSRPVEPRPSRRWPTTSSPWGRRSVARPRPGRGGEPVMLLGAPAAVVGRGGEKLDAALCGFAVDVPGGGCPRRRRIDRRVHRLRAATGSRSVVAVDVGHGQLHERLRGDARVEDRERTNVRHLTPDARRCGRHGSGRPVVHLADPVLPALLGCAGPGGHLVLLVKPQFEAGRVEVSRGRGVIRDPAIHERVKDEVGAALDAAGATIMGWMESPLLGADGNKELFVHARAPGPS